MKYSIAVSILAKVKHTLVITKLVSRKPEGRYRFFLNYHHKFVDWKKIKTNFIISKALFGVA